MDPERPIEADNPEYAVNRSAKEYSVYANAWLL
jgi:hypothetical protein